VCGGFEGQLLAMLITFEVEEYCRKQGLASTLKKEVIKVVGSWEDWSVPLIMIQKGSVLISVKEGKRAISFFYEA